MPVTYNRSVLSERDKNVVDKVGLTMAEDQFYRYMRTFFPETEPKMTKDKSVNEAATSTADARQAGGDHYKKLTVQPWDAMESWLTPEEFRGFLKGNIIKYMARANSGKEDHNLMLQKAEHYQQKLAEMTAKWTHKS